MGKSLTGYFSWPWGKESMGYLEGAATGQGRNRPGQGGTGPDRVEGLTWPWETRKKESGLALKVVPL